MSSSGPRKLTRTPITSRAAQVDVCGRLTPQQRSPGDAAEHAERSGRIVRSVAPVLAGGAHEEVQQPVAVDVPQRRDRRAEPPARFELLLAPLCTFSGRPRARGALQQRWTEKG